MTENETKTEKTTEYSFVNRNTGRRGAAGSFGGEVRASEQPQEKIARGEDDDGQPDFFSDPPQSLPEDFAGQSRKRPMRGIAFVLAVQTLLALLLVLGAVAVRLIGGETAQKVAQQYEQLTQSGAVDLKSLFSPIKPESDTASGTALAGDASSQTENASSASDSPSENALSSQTESAAVGSGADSGTAQSAVSGG